MKWVCGWIGLPLLAASTIAGALEVPQVVGEAYSVKDRTLLYREFHFPSDDSMSRRIEYRLDDGGLLATKHVDYSSGSTTPSFHQRDARYGEELSITRIDDGLEMAYREQASEPLERRRVAAAGVLVIDAGFDHFITHNWASLLQGEVMQFLFPVPARLDLLTLRIQRWRCSELPWVADPESMTSKVCFRIEPQSVVLRWLAEPIDLVYSASDPRLLVYRGLSNIAGEQGGGQQVEIRYDYTQQHTQQPLARFDAGS